MTHVGPLIEAQLKEEKHYGKDWPEKTVRSDLRVYDYGHSFFALQNNLISWFLEEEQGSQRTVRELTVRILAGNAATQIFIGHVSLMPLLLIHQFLKTRYPIQALTDVLYDLAAHPEYVAPLREEVEAIIEAEGPPSARCVKWIAL